MTFLVYEIRVFLVPADKIVAADAAAAGFFEQKYLSKVLNKYQ